MSNISTFAAVFEANPVTNNVRPVRCIDMLLGLASVLMAMGSSQLPVPQSLGGVRTDFG